MDEQEVRELFAERLANLSAEAEYQLRHPDYAMEMPQSGERIRARDNMRLRRVVGLGDVWVVEGSANWSGRIYHVANVVEFRDGKILRETRYYADPSRRRPGEQNGSSGWNLIQLTHETPTARIQAERRRFRGSV